MNFLLIVLIIILAAATVIKTADVYRISSGIKMKD
jgi:hypothetical protein